MAYTPKTWTTGETITAAELTAIEAGVQAAAATADTANAGLGSKVNSSTYTAGLAGKADLPTGGTDGQALVKAGGTTAWATVAGGTTPDATTTTKGAVQLAGDLAGTAAAPTVPGLAAKANTASLALVATTGSYTDLTNKPTIPAAYTDEQAQDAVAAAFAAGTQTGVTVAYNDAANSLSITATGTTSPNATTTSPGLVQLAGDLAGTATSPTVPGLAGKLTAASNLSDVGNAATARTNLGLATVAATGAYSDLSGKPTIPTVGAAGAGAAVALSSTDTSVTNARTPTAHTHPVADLTATGTRDATTFLRGDGTWAATPAAAGAADATTTTKGLVQLAGDLAGTATAPTVPGLAGKLTAANNLSDVATPATARTNLGLGSAATQSTSAFDAAGAAAAAQAAAVQRANHTGTQAASTITGLATVATSGSYTDLSGKPTIPTVGAAGAGAAVALSSTDASVTNARTPTAHAASHASGGSDPITPAAIGAAPVLVTQTTQTGTAYTLALADGNTLVESNNAAAVTLTVPPNSSVAYPVGTSISLRQYGAGQVTIAAGAGVTLQSRGGALKLAGQYAEATLTKRATDEWIVSGDLA